MKNKSKILIITIFLLIGLAKGVEAQWVKTGLDSTYNIRDIVVKGNNFYAVTTDNLYLSTNNGLSWTSIYGGLPSWGGILSIAFKGTDIFVGTYYGLYVSSNNGANWISKPSPSSTISAITTNDSLIFVACGNYGVYKSADNGSTWTNMSNGLTSAFIYSIAIKDTNIYVGLNLGGVYKSTINGLIFNAVNSGMINTNVFNFIFKDSSIYIGTSAGIYLSTNYCNSWSNIYNNGVLSVNVIDTSIFASTNGYGLYLSKSKGQGWSNISDGLTNLSYNSRIVLIGDTLYSAFNNGIWKQPYTELKVKDTITLSANPSSSGIISGGGVYNICQLCTVKAKAKYGYIFVDWTENGNIVSLDTNYTFPVTSSRNLVANFFPQYFVYIDEEPLNGGTTSGAGSYDVHELCFLKAKANIGYVFTGWTDEGDTVCTDTCYSFNVNYDRYLVANFSSTVGIKENKLNNNISIYPNPTSKSLTIETNSNTKQNLEIVNLLGQTMYTYNIYSKATIDVSAFPKGIYLIKLNTDKGIMVKKFVKE